MSLGSPFRRGFRAGHILALRGLSLLARNFREHRVPPSYSIGSKLLRFRERSLLLLGCRSERYVPLPSSGGKCFLPMLRDLLILPLRLGKFGLPSLGSLALSVPRLGKLASSLSEQSLLPPGSKIPIGQPGRGHRECKHPSEEEHRRSQDDESFHRGYIGISRCGMEDEIPRAGQHWSFPQAVMEQRARPVRAGHRIDELAMPFICGQRVRLGLLKNLEDIEVQAEPEHPANSEDPSVKRHPKMSGVVVQYQCYSCSRDPQYTRKRIRLGNKSHHG